MGKLGSSAGSGSVAGLGERVGIVRKYCEEKELKKHLSGVHRMKRPNLSDGVREKPTWPSQVSNVRLE